MPIIDKELPDVPHCFIDFLKKLADKELLRLITMLVNEVY
jgi:hypothetical protein